MHILAFDSTNSTLSVALCRDDVITHKSTIYDSNKQSELLVLEIEAALNANHIWYHDLDYIAASAGPGSFTGVRIGLSVAKTLKAALDKPLILVDSLEILAARYFGQSQEIFVAIDARMDEFFIAHFDSNGTQKTPTQLVNCNNILDFLPQEKFILCGSGKAQIKALLQERNIDFQTTDNDETIQADVLALLVRQKILTNVACKNSDEANYLRKPRISERKK